MKIGKVELIVVAGVIVYVAFFAHPPPTIVSTVLSNPFGQVAILGAIVYTVVYHSPIIGIFLAIAYIMSTGAVFEYLDKDEQKPKEKAPPKSTGVPPPAVTGLLNSLMKKKGDTRLPQTNGNSVKTKPTAVVAPKPKPSPKIENFMNF